MIAGIDVSYSYISTHILCASHSCTVDYRETVTRAVPDSGFVNPTGARFEDTNLAGVKSACIIPLSERNGD